MSIALKLGGKSTNFQVALETKVYISLLIASLQKLEWGDNKASFF